MSKDKVIKSIKIAIAAVISIAIAAELGLQYSANAGIITVLSIQNTKRETIRSARNRIFAFLCALLIASGSFYLFGYTLLAFAIYLFLFALICLYAGWIDAIAMVSVLVTHFLIEKNMSLSLVLNESGLLLIGATIGILVNLHLRRQEGTFHRLAKEVDSQIKDILKRMAHWIQQEDKSNYTSDCFTILRSSIKTARTCALTNYNNALLHKDTYEMDYMRMREQQSLVLQDIYNNIKSISYIPKQVEQVAKLLEDIEHEYHENNTVEGLLWDLNHLLQDMKQQELPKIREEFEARAMLFYILKETERLLMIKRDFIMEHQVFDTFHSPVPHP